MSDQPRLFDGQVVSVAITAFHDGPQGWVVRMNWCRDGGKWDDHLPAFYSELTEQEAADVIVSVLEVLLPYSS